MTPIEDAGPPTTDRPLRVAIVGSGPSGFYAAGQLLADKQHTVEVDLYERLPTPWGLVRGGVAPDHPKIKSVSRVFEKTAAKPGFRFFGNVTVGRDVAHDELTQWYDAVIYTVGTAGNRRSGVPGEDLPGSHAATAFVGWYNGHPDDRDHAFDLSAERAIVVGNGNVAVDVARMLTLTPDELATTDTADHAIDALSGSQIREIVVLGRRGPEQAAFTTPELRELGELADADVVVDPDDLRIAPSLRAEDLDAATRQNMDLLHAYADRPASGKRKRIVLRFLSSPVEIVGAERVEGVRVVRNALTRDEHGALRAVPTDRTEVVPAGLVLRAIGYTGVPLPGVPFDERTGLIPHDGAGRVTGTARTYVAGWIKRGPSGVIGTNKKCAVDTVTSLLADVDGGALQRNPGARPADDVQQTLRERVGGLVTHAHWEAIDAAEKAAGEPVGRPRIKRTRVSELLDAAGLAAPSTVA